MRRVVLRVRLRRGWIALAACAIAGGALLLATAVSSASFETSRGDGYTCEFNGVVADLTPPIGPIINPSNNGTYDLHAAVTCVFTDGADPTTTTTFGGSFVSSGKYHNVLCETIELAGDNTIGPTEITGGPEGTIADDGGFRPSLYYIELTRDAGVIDIGQGLREISDGDYLQEQNPAGTVVWTPASSTGCATQGLQAIDIVGSFATTT